MLDGQMLWGTGEIILAKCYGRSSKPPSQIKAVLRLSNFEILAAKKRRPESVMGIIKSMEDILHGVRELGNSQLQVISRETSGSVSGIRKIQ